MVFFLDFYTLTLFLLFKSFPANGIPIPNPITRDPRID